MRARFVFRFLTGEYKTEAELKKAYRRLAKKMHPDNGGKLEDSQQLNAEYTRLMEKFDAERKAAAEKAAAEEAARKAAEEAEKRAAEEAARKAARKAAEKSAETEGDMPKRVADAIKALQGAGFDAGYHRRTYLWVNWPGAGKVRVNCLKNGEFKFSYHGRVFAGVKSIDDLVATLRQ